MGYMWDIIYVGREWLRVPLMSSYISKLNVLKYNFFFSLKMLNKMSFVVMLNP